MRQKKEGSRLYLNKNHVRIIHVSAPVVCHRNVEIRFFVNNQQVTMVLNEVKLFYQGKALTAYNV